MTALRSLSRLLTVLEGQVENRTRGFVLSSDIQVDVEIGQQWKFEHLHLISLSESSRSKEVFSIYLSLVSIILSYVRISSIEFHLRSGSRLNLDVFQVRRSFARLFFIFYQKVNFKSHPILAPLHNIYRTFEQEMTLIGKLASSCWSENTQQGCFGLLAWFTKQKSSLTKVCLPLLGVDRFPIALAFFFLSPNFCFCHTLLSLSYIDTI